VPPTCLACTVRGCGRPLGPAGRALACAAGHTFDRARSGYVNLLQPQDRRSLAAGDPKPIVDARARLIAGGAGRPLFARVIERAGTCGIGRGAAVVDLGSGSGDFLGLLVSQYAAEGVGIDISTAAAEHAARRFPHVAWIVANADRRLPLLDGSVQLVVSLHGRRNPPECARALARSGALMLAVPGPDDLIELREAIGGERVERVRTDGLVAEHAPSLALVERETVREQRRLDPDALRDLLRVTYRGARHRAAAQAHTLAEMDVTFESELCVFRQA
jgi:23S rRNA (guanine745-N1)-methyltransferase